MSNEMTIKTKAISMILFFIFFPPIVMTIIRKGGEKGARQEIPFST
jgi:hypothetical protein